MAQHTSATSPGRPVRRRTGFAALLSSLLGAAACLGSPPPVIPVGLDAFTMWERWPLLRIGQRTYMTSTYDRRGHNEGADASHFLYQLADDRNVTLDVAGPGVLAFARYNHWHGSPWHYTVDGTDHVVRESSSADPNHPVPDSVFLPEEPFPHPLTWTWSRTKGADLMWVPIPFERSFRMAYERTRYGTGYYIYHRYPLGADNLSRPIRSWTPVDRPPEDILKLVGESPLSNVEAMPGTRREGTHSLQPGETKTLIELETPAPAAIRLLRLSIDEPSALALGRARLRIWWDNADAPSIDAPVALFFGAGTLYNRTRSEYLVKAFPVTIRYDAGRVTLTTIFPMPFERSARIALTAPDGAAIDSVRWQCLHVPWEYPFEWTGHLHATYVDHGQPEPGRDLIFLDTNTVEGGGPWCGHFVGTSFIFTDRCVLTTLEGDPRFYFDDSNTPHAQGTGTEEWGGGGDYWGGRTMTLPFAGHPVGAISAKEAREPEDQIHSAYRFLLSDLMPFGRRARITFEHGGENRSQEHYRSVTYWYARRGACLAQTDSLHVGDEADARAHAYDSPDASPVQTLRSRYEWGPDHLDGRELFPETEDTGRSTTGTSTFRVRIDPANLGVLLRRKFDYAFPNQCAAVSVADDRDDAPWRDAGTWYAAGSNTVVHSNPREELGATRHEVQTSNRRWREDEFLIAPRLTSGREHIRIRLRFMPQNIPLFPGHPPAPQAWSAYRYTIYSYVQPRPQNP